MRQKERGTSRNNRQRCCTAPCPACRVRDLGVGLVPAWWGSGLGTATGSPQGRPRQTKCWQNIPPHSVSPGHTPVMGLASFLLLLATLQQLQRWTGQPLEDDKVLPSQVQPWTAGHSVRKWMTDASVSVPSLDNLLLLRFLVIRPDVEEQDSSTVTTLMGGPGQIWSRGHTVTCPDEAAPSWVTCCPPHPSLFISS
uniref:Uncharacterized protein n=1 Tax=Knipowitschia caucasica TaxID=637954 RepID=A0AAV2LP65_KNICA